MANNKADKEKKEEKETKSFSKEFVEFITRGNVVELAIGLTVGVAFTNLVNSLVQNLIMPLVGALLQGDAFADLYIALNGESYQSLADAEEASAPILKYGLVISDILDFFIIAFVIFLVIKFLTRAKLYRIEKNATIKSSK